MNPQLLAQTILDLLKSQDLDFVVTYGINQVYIDNYMDFEKLARDLLDRYDITPKPVPLEVSVSDKMQFQDKMG